MTSIKMTDGARYDFRDSQKIHAVALYGGRFLEIKEDEKRLFLNAEQIVSITHREEGE